MRLGLGLGIVQAQPPAGKLATEWAGRIAANGGTITPAAVSAAATLIAALRSLGVWDALDRFNPYAGSGGSATENLAGALVPLVARLGNPVDTIVNGGPSNYVVTGGMVADSSVYFRTGAVPRNAIGGLLLAINTGAAMGNRTIMGCSQTGVACRYYAPSTANHRGGNWGTSGLGTTGGVGGYNGCHVVRRRTLTDLARIRNGVLIQGDAGLSADAVPAVEMMVYSNNSNGTPGPAVTAGHTLAGYWMHNGVVDDGVFPNAVWSGVRTALATFYASLGRSLA